MSRLSDALRRWLGRTPEEDVMTIFRRIAGDSADEILHFAEVLVVALDHADVNKDAYVNKREMVTFLVKAACNAAGLRQMPIWVIVGVTEQILQRIRIPDFEIPVPTDFNPDNFAVHTEG